MGICPYGQRTLTGGGYALPFGSAFLFERKFLDRPRSEKKAMQEHRDTCSCLIRRYHWKTSYFLNDNEALDWTHLHWDWESARAITIARSHNNAPPSSVQMGPVQRLVVQKCWLWRYLCSLISAYSAWASVLATFFSDTFCCWAGKWQIAHPQSGGCAIWNFAPSRKKCPCSKKLCIGFALSFPRVPPCARFLLSCALPCSVAYWEYRTMQSKPPIDSEYVRLRPQAPRQIEASRPRTVTPQAFQKETQWRVAITCGVR